MKREGERRRESNGEKIEDMMEERKEGGRKRSEEQEGH